MKKTSKKKFDGIRQLYLSVIFSLKIYFRFTPWKLIIYTITTIIGRLEGILFTFIFARSIDQALNMISSGTNNFSDISKYLLLIFIFMVASSIVSNINALTRTSIRTARNGMLELILMEHYERIGIINLENPKVADKLNRTSNWIYITYDLMMESIRMFSSVIAMIVTGFSIFLFQPIIAILVILAAIIQFFPKRHYIRELFKWFYDNTEKRRIAWSSANVLTAPESLSEVFVVGGSDFFKSKFLGFWKSFNKRDLEIQKREAISLTLVELLEKIVMVFGYAVALRDAILQKISVGDVYFYMSILNTFNSSVNNIFENLTVMVDQSNKVYEVVELFDIKPLEDGDIPMKKLDEPPSISIRNLDFRYPNAKKYVFKDFNLEIKAGEKVAIVGANGAGKTTLVKLLSRFYNYQSGEILINGHELFDLKVDDWYKNIGILFQEYNFYSHLSVIENIYAGKPKMEHDRKRAIAAAKAADAHDFIVKYRHGYNQIMTEKVEGGTRASTGQKQKIAIARFLYRNAPLAIFDEPTAAIDAESEYKIFNEIYDFFKDKTVIIISHRFSTVRNADRIVVLDEGKIVEQGNHQQLMKKNGKYAKAFKLQASGYR